MSGENEWLDAEGYDDAEDYLEEIVYFSQARVRYLAEGVELGVLPGVDFRVVIAVEYPVDLRVGHEHIREEVIEECVGDIGDVLVPGFVHEAAHPDVKPRAGKDHKQ